MYPLFVESRERGPSSWLRVVDDYSCAAVCGCGCVGVCLCVCVWGGACTAEADIKV